MLRITGADLVRAAKALDVMWLSGPLKIDRAIERSVDSAIRIGAAVARTSHGWKNRTGALENSIKSAMLEVGHQRAVGEISAGLDSKARKYASVMEKGSIPHPIFPKNFNLRTQRAGTHGFLTFKVDGRWVIVPYVNHPGTRPYKFMRHGADTAEKYLVRLLDEALERATIAAIAR